MLKEIILLLRKESIKEDRILAHMCMNIEHDFFADTDMIARLMGDKHTIANIMNI